LNPKSSTACKKSAAHLVLDYIKREDIENYVNKLEIMLDTLSVLRTGFYCTLCSV